MKSEITYSRDEALPLPSPVSWLIERIVGNIVVGTLKVVLPDGQQMVFQSERDPKNPSSNTRSPTLNAVIR